MRLICLLMLVIKPTGLSMRLEFVARVVHVAKLVVNGGNDRVVMNERQVIRGDAGIEFACPQWAVPNFAHDFDGYHLGLPVVLTWISGDDKTVGSNRRYHTVVTDGPWVYDVTVEPKFERTSDGDDDDKGGDSDGGGSSDGQSGEDGSSNSSERAPQTSDPYALAAPVALAACGLSLVLLARRLS